MNPLQKRLATEKLHRCTPRECNSATFTPNGATATATAVQQPPATPVNTRVLSATATATAVQPASCIPCNSVQLLAHPVQPGCDPFDDRVLCVECKHLWTGNRCARHRAAGFNHPVLPAELTRQRQRCPAHTARGGGPHA